MDLAVQFLEPYTFDLVLPDSWSHSALSRQVGTFVGTERGAVDG